VFERPNCFRKYLIKCIGQCALVDVLLRQVIPHTLHPSKGELTGQYGLSLIAQAFVLDRDILRSASAFSSLCFVYIGAYLEKQALQLPIGLLVGGIEGEAPRSQPELPGQKDVDSKLGTLYRRVRRRISFGPEEKNVQCVHRVRRLLPPGRRE
jgi:hypothetical protein